MFTYSHSPKKNPRVVTFAIPQFDEFRVSKKPMFFGNIIHRQHLLQCFETLKISHRMAMNKNVKNSGNLNIFLFVIRRYITIE